MNFDQILVERNRREQAIRDSVTMTSMSRHTLLTPVALPVPPPVPPPGVAPAPEAVAAVPTGPAPVAVVHE